MILGFCCACLLWGIKAVVGSGRRESDTGWPQFAVAWAGVWISSLHSCLKVCANQSSPCHDRNLPVRPEGTLVLKSVLTSLVLVMTATYRSDLRAANCTRKRSLGGCRSEEAHVWMKCSSWVIKFCRSFFLLYDTTEDPYLHFTGSHNCLNHTRFQDIGTNSPPFATQAFSPVILTAHQHLLVQGHYTL